jgi:hypothetical protein
MVYRILFLLCLASTQLSAQLLPDALTTAKDLHGKGKFAEAYSEYQRARAMGDSSTAVRFYLAQVCMSLDKPAEALEHISFVLAREQRNPSSWVIRGEARRQTGDSAGACDDFVQAELRGNRTAGLLLEQYCGRKSTEAPRIVFAMPSPEWYAADVQRQGRAETSTWLAKRDSVDDANESFTVTIVDGVDSPGPPDTLMMGIVQQAKRQNPQTAFAKISTDTLAGTPCALFTMSAPANGTLPTVNQLWLMTHANKALYIVHYDTFDALKGSRLATWLAVLRSMRFAL